MNAAVYDTTQQMLKMTLCPYIFVWVLRRAQEYLPTGKSDTQLHTMDCCALLLGLCGSAQKLNPAKYRCLVTSLRQHIAPEVLERACAVVARDILRYALGSLWLAFEPEDAACTCRREDFVVCRPIYLGLVAYELEEPLCSRIEEMYSCMSASCT